MSILKWIPVQIALDHLWGGGFGSMNILCVFYSRLSVHKEDKSVDSSRHLFQVLCLALYTLCMDNRVTI